MMGSPKIGKSLAVLAPLAILALGLLAAKATPTSPAGSGSLSEAEMEATALCIDCHENYDQDLAHTAHAIGVSGSANQLQCVNCHGGAVEHVEDPTPENITSPGELAQFEQDQLCASCHMPHGDARTIGFDPHITEGLACLDCHAIHQGQENLLSQPVNKLCESCHTGVTLQFMRRSNHPLNDGAVDCTSCHTMTGEKEPMFGHGQSANCYSCHAEQSGPHLHEHPVTLSFATEGIGCIGCHEPHGSPNDRLLKSSGNNLCQSCHGTPPLHMTKHSGLGAKLNCVDCHSQTHGSNDNSLFLDPDLGNKLFPNCYQSGCHDMIK